MRLLKTITSRNNSHVKNIVKLLASKKQRHQQNLFVAEGARLSYEVFLAKLPIVELYYTEQALQRYPSQLQKIKQVAQNEYLIPEELASQISDTGAPQGIFVVSSFPKSSENTIPLQKNGNYLLLDGLQDPGNVGAILRTAWAFGLTGAWISNTADIYSPKVLRAAMGGAFRLPIIEVEDLSATIATLQNLSVSVWATALVSDAEELNRTMFKTGGAVVIGNEGAGLTEERIAQCSGSVRIPMVEGAESLNAGIAASILFWEMSQAAREGKG